MSYTFLQEQGEESSAECFSDIGTFVIALILVIALLVVAIIDDCFVKSIKMFRAIAP